MEKYVWTERRSAWGGQPEVFLRLVIRESAEKSACTSVLDFWPVGGAVVFMREKQRKRDGIDMLLSGPGMAGIEEGVAQREKKFNLGKRSKWALVAEQ